MLAAWEPVFMLRQWDKTVCGVFVYRENETLFGLARYFSMNSTENT